MDITNNRILKYTFIIIPFRFTGKVNIEEILHIGVFELCDREKIKYDRLYKHIANEISEDNENRTIYDFWYNRQKNNTDLFYSPLQFNVKTETGKEYHADGFIKDVFAYCFSNGIGFLVVNIVFDENINMETMCELLNKLKKIRPNQNKALFSIMRANKFFDLYEFVTQLPNGLGLEYDLFFQHSNQAYVSATMMSSFTYTEKTCFEKLDEKEHILDQLECLKRAQGNSYGTFEENKKYIRPFQNMFWGVSTQGVGNINYYDEEVGNISFLEVFYRNIKREYLLMVLLVLNQELTLLDYCQKFTTSWNELVTNEEMLRLYDFKIKGTFTTVSHLEHYRAFYQHYCEEMNIQQLFEEVDTKQKSIYQANKNELSEARQKREHRVNRFTKILSIILSIFGISGLINNVGTLIERKNYTLAIIVVLCVIVGIVVVLSFVNLGEKMFDNSLAKRKLKSIKTSKKRK